MPIRHIPPGDPRRKFLLQAQKDFFPDAPVDWDDAKWYNDAVFGAQARKSYALSGKAPKQIDYLLYKRGITPRLAQLLVQSEPYARTREPGTGKWVYNVPRKDVMRVLKSGAPGGNWMEPEKNDGLYYQQARQKAIQQHLSKGGKIPPRERGGVMDRVGAALGSFNAKLPKLDSDYEDPGRGESFGRY
jgi:hypothetical protein